MNVMFQAKYNTYASSSSLMATIIPTFLWGWAGEAWPNYFTNQLARPNVRLRLGQGFEIGSGC